MPKREPIRINRTSPVEQQIREAQERGEFDDLPGEGRPLEDLDEATDPAWWAKKLLRRERLSMLPPALEIRRRVEQDLARVPTLPHEGEVRELVEELNREIRKRNARATSGPPTSIAPLDPDEIVARWHEHRAEP